MLYFANGLICCFRDLIGSWGGEAYFLNYKMYHMCGGLSKKKVF